jgi:hypothetical protein
MSKISGPLVDRIHIQVDVTLNLRRRAETLPPEIMGESAWTGIHRAIRTKAAGNVSVICARAIVTRRSSSDYVIWNLKSLNINEASSAWFVKHQCVIHDPGCRTCSRNSQKTHKHDSSRS